MKLSKVILIVVLLITLSSCQKNDFEEVNKTLNGYSIYKYDTGTEACAGWYTDTVDLPDGGTYSFYNFCPIEYYVMVNNQYISVSRFVQENKISREEINQLGFGYYTPPRFKIKELMEIEIGDFMLESVIVREYKNQMKRFTEWDSVEYIDMSYDDMLSDITALLYVEVPKYSQCGTMFCVPYGSNAPIVVSLVNGEKAIHIHLFEESYSIDYFDGEQFTVGYFHLTDEFDHAYELYHAIYIEYLEVNE